jgi:hypothetical protein
MAIAIARVLSNSLAVLLIVLGFGHLGMLYAVLRPSDLLHLAPAVICPGLIVAGAGIFARKRWGFYLAYLIIAFNLLLLLQSPRYMLNLYDYYLHVPFMHVSSYQFVNWQQILVSHLIVGLALVASHIVLDRGGQLGSPLPRPYMRRLAIAGLILSSLVFAVPIAFIALAAYADPPGNSPGSFPGGYVLILIFHALWPFVISAIVGIIVCIWILRTQRTQGDAEPIATPELNRP